MVGLLVLVQVSALFVTSFTRSVVDGKVTGPRATSHACAAIRTVLAEGVHDHVEVRLTLAIEQIMATGVVGDPLKHLQAGVSGGITVGHVLHYLKTAAGLDDGFAPPGRAASTHGVVAEISRSNEWGITHTSRDFVTQPAGGGAGSDIALRIDRRAMNRAVVKRQAESFGVGLHAACPDMLIIVEPVIARIEIFFPLEPDFAGALGEQVFFFEAVSEGELLGTLADDEHMIGAPTNPEGDHRRILDVFDSGHGSGLMGWAMHDAGVELDHAVLVGYASVADGHVVGVVLNELHTIDHSIERIAARTEHLHRLGDGGDAVAGADANGSAPARLGGPSLSFGEIRERGGSRRDSQKRSSIDVIHDDRVQEDHLSWQKKSPTSSEDMNESHKVLRASN